MSNVVSWNIGKHKAPWREPVRMAGDGDADVALVQEAGRPPGDVVDLVDYDDHVFWNRHVYDRWPLIVQLSDRLTVESYRHVPPISDLWADTIGVSGIGTIAAAKVTPRDSEDEAFIVVSMYARWLQPHPSTKSRWRVGYSDASAHRIISDLSAFIGYSNPTKHRILAAGDLNMFYGATGRTLSLPARDRTVWERMQALGLACLGPQAPHGRRADWLRISAHRRPVRHEERADGLLRWRRAGHRRESIGLRVRVARVPREGVGAGDEQGVVA